MNPDNLIEIARQADAIVGDQDDGFEGFEPQMRRALARSYPVGADAIEVLVDDIDAAMFTCGHELVCSRDDAGNLHYRIGERRASRGRLTLVSKKPSHTSAKGFWRF